MNNKLLLLLFSIDLNIHEYISNADYSEKLIPKHSL